MPIELPKGLPFSVDTWTSASKSKRHHFLTHAHKDHAQGITAHSSYPVYSTSFTKTLIRRYYPKLDDSIFIGIEVGQTLIVNDPDGNFTVTAFDANHCPGSLMFLFEGYFGNVLHTGDCRLTPECLQSLPGKYIGTSGKRPKCPLDYIFLDCTFAEFQSRMPCRSPAIQQVINCIWKHPDATLVYLTCDMLGQEEILVKVSQTFGNKIYVDRVNNSECYKALDLTIPEYISQDPSTRFHLFDGSPKLCERAESTIKEARANFQKEPLIISPSAQWYACNEGTCEIESWKKQRFDQAVRDHYGVWHVCYSIHSSRDELEWALQLLAPKWVASTTVCRAIELDYVKKLLSNKNRDIDDSLWRLMDMSSSVVSAEPNVRVKTTSTSGKMENISVTCVETQSEPDVLSSLQSKRLSLSPASKKPKVTLFGRARLGFQDSSFLCKQKEIEDILLNKEEASELNHEDLANVRKTNELAEATCSWTDTKKTECTDTFLSPVSLSNSYKENLRKFYRSRHVPVPQPLPSLVELMNAKNMQRRVSNLRFSLAD